jgi:tetratricopeptide (TPR) repeat protein
MATTTVNDTKAPGAAPANEPHFAPPGHEPIPIWLMIAIFAGVGLILVLQMYKTWLPDWHQYQARQRQLKSDWNSAVTHLQWLQKQNTPDQDPLKDTAKNPTYLSEQGHCYAMLGDYVKSEQFYREAQQYRSNIPPDEQGGAREPSDFTTDIGYAQFMQGNLDAADKTLQQSLKNNKVDRVANFTLGELEMKRGNYQKAASYYKVVARDPQFGPKVKERYAEIEKKLFAGVH